MVEHVLNAKTDQDIQHEKEKHISEEAGDTAASLTAREARIDRNRTFWNSSKWAKKLKKGVSNLLTNVSTTAATSTYTSTTTTANTNTTKTTTTNNHTKIKNKLTPKQQPDGANNDKYDMFDASHCNHKKFNCNLFFALCRTYGIIIARWGGSGNEDITGITTKQDQKQHRQHHPQQQQQTPQPQATSKADPCILSLLNVLSFSTDIVKSTWAFIQSDDNVMMSHIQTAIKKHHITTTTATAAGTVVTNATTITSQTIRPNFNNLKHGFDSTSSSSSAQKNNTNSILYAIKKNIKQANSSSTTTTTGAGEGGDVVMDNDGMVLLFMFLSTLSHTLIITDDVEIHDMDKPLPIHQIRRCIVLLKKLLYQACTAPVPTTTVGPDSVHASASASASPSPNMSTVAANTYIQQQQQQQTNYFGLALVARSVGTMRELYDRSSRRPLCLPKLWMTDQVDQYVQQQMKHCKSHSQYIAVLTTLPILRICPFLVSFKRRLQLFERIVTTNREEVQGVHDNHLLMNNPLTNALFNNNPLKPGIPVQIMRGRVLEDGLRTLNKLGSNLRQRIAVQYVNQAGSKEIGVDAGGLFKEFWTDLCAIAFDPNYALFCVTEDNDHCLYPCPSSMAAHGSDHIVLFEFLGRILGKALYEGITIHPQFAHFFLSFLRGNYNYLHMLHDLSTIDQQLYNNLMFLKTYPDDAQDLCLSFTVTSDQDFGINTEIPLIPNGPNVSVTNTNKQRYIELVAKYYVVDRVKEQSEAFTRGLWDVIDRGWLQIFNEPELQVLISGSTDGGKLDIDDMRSNTRYIGGFTGMERTTARFWNVLSNFSPQQQRLLLKFVTSCERPPPLGFSSMNPPFTIQRVGILHDSDMLPSASTCFNTLKLPTYSSEKVLRQRLLYAIQSGAGFELS